MDVVLTALGELIEPSRLLMLACGVLAGLVIGVIPGIGGIFGLTLLVPLTYALDPYAAFALLLGMSSVLTTSDTIPAVLIGVPGTVGAIATVMDGHPMAKKNQAGRAFGAAYTSSMIGGVFGALVLAASIPIMKPLVLFLNFGDLLAVTIFGLTLVAILAGSAPVKGLIAALLGILAGYVGLDPQLGTERWTFGELYLWEGLPVAVIFLGLFGIPELASLFFRGQIQISSTKPEPGGVRRGVRDALREWKLVLSSSTIGSLLGAVPGIGIIIIDWIAYARATRRRRPGDVPYGEGNVRGVIAPESANNAKESGSLIPTIALGIPGSVTMAILLGAFTIQGLTPGPRMLTEHAPILVAMILSIALANIMGAGLCLALTRHLVKLALVPARVLVPLAIVFVAVGAFVVKKDVLDLAFLISFGLLGIVMHNLSWPRAAFALGFVLGPNLERFSFLTLQLSGWSWLTQPVVIAILALTVFAVVQRERARRRSVGTALPQAYPLVNIGFTGLLATLAVYCLVTASQLPFDAGVFPMVTSGLLAALTFAYLAYLVLVRIRPQPSSPSAPIGRFGSEVLLLVPAAGLAVLMLAFGRYIAAIGFIIACGLWLGGTKLPRLIVRALVVALVIFIVFDLLVPQTWPKPWLFGF
ncbi:MAG: tripartite tricarboxylate transporter permease [Bauldia sp.]|nr:tripartite tricarboxylate transporter permease [Bauldia sp.]